MAITRSCDAKTAMANSDAVGLAAQHAKMPTDCEQEWGPWPHCAECYVTVDDDPSGSGNRHSAAKHQQKKW